MFLREMLNYHSELIIVQQDQTSSEHLQTDYPLALVGVLSFVSLDLSLIEEVLHNFEHDH